MSAEDPYAGETRAERRRRLAAEQAGAGPSSPGPASPYDPHPYGVRAYPDIEDAVVEEYPDAPRPPAGAPTGPTGPYAGAAGAPPTSPGHPAAGARPPATPPASPPASPGRDRASAGRDDTGSAPLDLDAEDPAATAAALQLLAAQAAAARLAERGGTGRPDAGRAVPNDTGSTRRSDAGAPRPAAAGPATPLGAGAPGGKGGSAAERERRAADRLAAEKVAAARRAAVRAAAARAAGVEQRAIAAAAHAPGAASAESWVGAADATAAETAAAAAAVRAAGASRRARDAAAAGDVPRRAAGAATAGAAAAGGAAGTTVAGAVLPSAPGTSGKADGRRRSKAPRGTARRAGSSRAARVSYGLAALVVVGAGAAVSAPQIGALIASTASHPTSTTTDTAGTASSTPATASASGTTAPGAGGTPGTTAAATPGATSPLACDAAQWAEQLASEPAAKEFPAAGIAAAYCGTAATMRDISFTDLAVRRGKDHPYTAQDFAFVAPYLSADLKKQWDTDVAALVASQDPTSDAGRRVSALTRLAWDNDKLRFDPAAARATDFAVGRPVTWTAKGTDGVTRLGVGFETGLVTHMVDATGAKQEQILRRTYRFALVKGDGAHPWLIDAYQDTETTAALSTSTATPTASAAGSTPAGPVH